MDLVSEINVDILIYKQIKNNNDQIELQRPKFA